MVKVRDISLATNPRSHLTCSVPASVGCSSAEPRRRRSSRRWAPSAVISPSPWRSSRPSRRKTRGSPPSSRYQGLPLHLADYLFIYLESAEKKSRRWNEPNGHGALSKEIPLLRIKASGCIYLCPLFSPERGKKKKKLLPGDHLTYFVCLPFRKRRVTDCVVDCSSKILFPWRCCGSPNTPCCSRTSQSTQVPHWVPRHLGGEQSVPLFYAHAATSHGSRRDV